MSKTQLEVAKATYDAFDRAFPRVSAFTLMREGETVGRIAVKHADLSVTAFLQLWGAEMTKGRATGGGYDRVTAALEIAAAKLGKAVKTGMGMAHRDALVRFMAQPERDGQRWATRLEGAGFTVHTAIDG